MMHKEFLDHIGSTTTAFVNIKPGKEELISEKPIVLGGPSVTVRQLCASSQHFPNLHFLPGEYDTEELQILFKKNYEVKSVKVRGNWIIDYLPSISETIENFSVDSSNVFKLPNCVFPQLTHLCGGKLRFSRESFPKLAHLQAVCDKPLMDELKKIKCLDVLNFTKCNEAQILDLVQHKELKFLGIRSGTYTNLSELCELNTLNGLWVQEIRGELDMSKLIKSSIKELTIGYCNNLTNLEAIICSGNLDAINVFGCKNLDKIQLKLLMESNLQHYVFN